MAHRKVNNLILLYLIYHPILGEDKDGLLGPKKDKYKVYSLLTKAPLKYRRYGHSCNSTGKETGKTHL